MRSVDLRSKKRNIGEIRFEWLLCQRGCSFVDEHNLEKKISVKSNRPDFFAWKGNISFLAEIKEFESAGPLDNRTRCGAVAVNDILDRLRRSLDEASRQLKPYKDLKVARIVVFDNNQQVGVPTSPLEIIQLFGTINRRLNINQYNEKLEDEGWKHGPRQIITRDRKQYISAVAVNLPKTSHTYCDQVNIERPMRLQIIHNPYAIYPLDKRLFIDPEDAHFEMVDGEWINGITSERLLSM
jgi:hypothetical protein